MMMPLLHTFALFCTLSSILAESIGSSLLTTRVSMKKKALDILQTEGDAVAPHKSVKRNDLTDTAAALEELAAGVVNGTEVVSATVAALLSSIREDLDAIIAESMEEHRNDQTVIDGAIQPVKECEDVLSEYPPKAIAAKEAEEDHDNCRTKERELLDAKITRCDEYDHASSDQAEPPACMCNDCYNPNPQPEDYATGLACLQQIDMWSADLYKTLSEKKQSCDDATEEHDAAVQHCNANQTSFEVAFCSYRESLTGACSSYPTCRAEKLGYYRDVEGVVKTNENGRRAEISSERHIRCLLTVFETPTEQQMDKLQECNGVTVEEAELAAVVINYPSVPPEVPCDPSPVNLYPCKPEWLHNHYETRPWYSDAPTAECLQAPGCEDIVVPVPGVEAVSCRVGYEMQLPEGVLDATGGYSYCQHHSPGHPGVTGGTITTGGAQGAAECKAACDADATCEYYGMYGALPGVSITPACSLIQNCGTQTDVTDVTYQMTNAGAVYCKKVGAVSTTGATALPLSTTLQTTSSSPTITAPKFVLGDLGVKMCPAGHEPVRETAECERAAAALGASYLPSLNRGVGGGEASCQFLAGHSGGGCDQKCMVVTDELYTIQYQLACRPLAYVTSRCDDKGGKWYIFGDIDDRSSNFDAADVEDSPTKSGVGRGESAQVGTFSAGSVGSPGYSFDLQQLASHVTGGTFDLMIQFGSADVYEQCLSGFSMTDGHFVNNNNLDAETAVAGPHGMWGSASESIGGYYATFCAVGWSCGGSGSDYWTFSTNKGYPSTANSVVCGFWGHGRNPSSGWKDCPSGDKVRRMRYYVRFAE